MNGFSEILRGVHCRVSVKTFEHWVPAWTGTIAQAHAFLARSPQLWRTSNLNWCICCCLQLRCTVRG